MPYCSKCGTQNRDGASFCKECGTPIRRRSSSQNNAPAYTSPVQGNPIPTYTPPVQENPVPTFTPPVQEDPIPTFTPPVQENPIPTFTPPVQEDPIPTFTPPVQEDPIPMFTPPPRPRHSGPSCYYHQDEPAVAQCARCGKFICQDCADNYGVVAGEYAGQALCYDCCQQIVAENVEELTRNKNTIKRQFTLSLIGMTIGFLFGFISGIANGSIAGGLGAGFAAACIGGVFLSALKAYFSMMWETIKTGFQHGWVAALIGAFIGCFIIGIKCIWATISNTIYYISYLKKTSGFIESDTACLQQMKDYMEYTLIRSQNVGVDINTLLQEESRLADNSYARMVQSCGEEQAEAALRNCVTTINENGEIIRSFATS